MVDDELHEFGELFTNEDDVDKVLLVANFCDVEFVLLACEEFEISLRAVSSPLKSGGGVA